MKNLKEKLKTAKAVKGIFLQSGCPAIAEMAGGCGYDFAVIDGEHGQGGESASFDQIARLEKYETAALVRIPAYRHEYVKRMLDYGADGILAPMVESPEQARDYARSMRYPPHGTRGMTGIFRAADYNNDFRNYYAGADSALLCAAQIESARGVENVEAIASVEGIDLLFIGHSDLSIDYGCYKQFSDPRIIEAERRIIAAARDNGKFVGMVLRPNMDMDEYVASGVNFICLGTDLAMIQKAFQHQLNC
ncbi:MAG: hypothetical protein IJJ33_07385 [Victivallales bacterium]|nr:hypothetical protein [Victivallales bacterium]